MSEHPRRSQIESRLRWSLLKLFQIFIVLCLIDGFLDITYPLASFTKNHLIRKVSETSPAKPVKPGSVQDIILPTPGFSVRQEPGIRGIVAEYHSPNINVAIDGLRYNSPTPSENSATVGLLLGSSAAFGYGVADNQTLAAHLERSLKDVRLDNYAGLAQPITDSTLRWYDYQKKHGKPDFVILASANYQIFADCQPVPAVNTKSNIFLFLAEKIADRFSPKTTFPCASNGSLDLAIRNSILAIENAVAFGRKQGIPFHIVNLPTPYDANVNIDNLLKEANAKAQIAAMQRVYSRFHEELAKLELPEFIDLSHSLPSDKMYFLDTGGHISGEGNRLIAETLRQRIWGNKFSNSRD
ncbi:hypothetical protein ACLIIZ_15190 [Azonexus caeni]|uniref:hypothetical protein n=1 Tax=Azonexus caeni TaxID=266126 RepID=UPI003A86CE30